MGAGGPRARAIETAGRWFGPLAQRRPKPDRDKAFAEIRRAWHFIDAKGEILGRLAAKIAPLLCGKHKPIFQPARDVGTPRAKTANFPGHNQPSAAQECWQPSDLHSAQVVGITIILRLNSVLW